MAYLLVKCLVYFICAGCLLIWIKEKYSYIRNCVQGRPTSKNQYVLVIGKTVLESIPLIAAILFIRFLLNNIKL